jgi:hypothetical protein
MQELNVCKVPQVMEMWLSVVSRQGQMTNRHDAVSVKSHCSEPSWRRRGMTMSYKPSRDERN